MPEFDQVDSFPSECDDLPRVPFGIWKNMLFASCDPETTLEDLLGAMDERVGWMPLKSAVYDSSRARDYLVKAHWALYVDNYLEGFHIPYIHAELAQSLDYGSYRTEMFKWGNVQIGAAKGGEFAFELPRDSADFGESIAAYYYWIFPNMMFNFYPWGCSINVVRPLAPSLTKISFFPYVWDAAKIGAGAGAALDRVEREDEAVVELVQRGVRSRFYDRGRYSPEREKGVHQFHALISAAMSR
jgi:choline monooxygenase